MEILIFILLAGLWAAFLLPPFLSSRRNTPISSTQHFDRSLARLASVQGHGPARTVVSRDQVLARRRRVLIGLASAAALSLLLALWWRSLNLLFLHLVVDALGVGYVALLLDIKQRRAVAGVPDIHFDTFDVAAAEEEQAPPVRVVASS